MYGSIATRTNEGLMQPGELGLLQRSLETETRQEGARPDRNP